MQGRGEHRIDGPPRHELYDLTADPGEITDLAATHPEIVNKMTGQYEAWFADVTIRWAENPELQHEDRNSGKKPAILDHD